MRADKTQHPRDGGEAKALLDKVVELAQTGTVPGLQGASVVHYFDDAELDDEERKKCGRIFDQVRACSRDAVPATAPVPVPALLQLLLQLHRRAGRTPVPDRANSIRCRAWHQLAPLCGGVAACVCVPPCVRACACACA